VIRQIRAGLPEVEFLLFTSGFGSADPRDDAELGKIRDPAGYAASLKKLAAEERCAFLDMRSPWIEAMRSLGYDVQYRDICAADYGVPTSRLRTFIIARKDRPVYWPEPTHAQNGAGGLKPWRPASEVIDFDDMGISIFDRKKPLVEKTLRRIRIGLNRFVGMPVRQDMRGYLGLNVLEEFREDGLETAFLCKYFKSGTAVSLRDPLDTITTHDRFGLVNVILDGSAIADIRYRILKPVELACAMNFDGLQLTGHKNEDVFYIGNSVACGVTDAIMRTFLN